MVLTEAMGRLHKRLSRSNAKLEVSRDIQPVHQELASEEPGADSVDGHTVSDDNTAQSIHAALRIPPTVPPGQHGPRPAGARLDSSTAAFAINPPRYSVSNMDSDLAEYPPLLQRRTPLGLPPSRGLKGTWQDMQEGGSVRNILPCRSFRETGIENMPPEENLFVGFFNRTALHYKQNLMQRSGMTVEQDGALRVNDKLIKELDMKNRPVRVIARRRRLQARKFIECVILDGRVDPNDGKCNVLYEVRWLST